MPQFEFPGRCGSSNSKGIASGPIIVAVHVHILNERPRRLAKSPATKTELVVITIKRKIAAISIPRSPTLSVRRHLCGNPFFVGPTLTGASVRWPRLAQQYRPPATVYHCEPSRPAALMPG